MKCPNPTFLTYTQDDDGVHVQCNWQIDKQWRDCRFDKNLGFYATSADVLQAEQEHRECELPE